MERNTGELLAEILKRDRFAELQTRAEHGDGFAQMLLAEILCYGIDTDDAYWQNLERSLALANPSRGFAFPCSCTRTPNPEEALKWYRMAALGGNADAAKKAKELEAGMLPKPTSAMLHLISQRKDEPAVKRTVYELMCYAAKKLRKDSHIFKMVCSHGEFSLTFVADGELFSVYGSDDEGERCASEALCTGTVDTVVAYLTDEANTDAVFCQVREYQG